MNRRRISYILLVLSLALVLSLSLVACKTKEYVPEKQGSRVVVVDNETLNGPVVETFNKYNEFNGSKYANMKLDGSDFPMNKSYYRREFFRDHDLVAIKFNDVDNVCFTIDNVVRDGNKFKVDLVRLRDTTKTKTSIITHAIFLEVPTRDKLKDVHVDFNATTRDIITSETGTSLLTDANSNPLEVFAMSSVDELNAYMSHVDDKTKAILKKFDKNLLASHVFVALDYKSYENSIPTVSYDATKNILNVDLYTTDHYVPKTHSRVSRQVKYFPIERSSIFTKVRMTTHFEDDFDIHHEPMVYEIDFRPFYISKAR